MIIKYWLIFSCLCGLFSNKAAAQNVFHKADSLFAVGTYFPAAVEYERIVFQSEDLKEKSLALLKKSYAYKAHGAYQKSFNTLQRIDIYDLNDSLQFEIRYEKILNAYLAGNYKEAEAEIIQLEYYTDDEAKADQARYLKILVLNELQQWQEAKNEFEIYIKNKDANFDVEEVYYFTDKPKIRDPKKASLLSTFIPGAGQIYGGAVLSGLGSFAIQSALLAFGIYNLWSGYYFTGFFTGLGMFQAFYFGGIQHAAYVTNKKNEEKIRKYNDGVKEIILNIEKDLK